MRRVLDEMDANGIARNVLTYRHIIQFHATTSQTLAQCLVFYNEMREAGLRPDLQTIEELINLALLHSCPRLALDLALEFEDESNRDLPLSLWSLLLGGSASNHFVSINFQSLTISRLKSPRTRSLQE
jgi:hypothetical protein